MLNFCSKNLQQAKIITLYEHTSMSQRKIAKTVGVSKGSVYHILKQKKREHGNVNIKIKVWKETKNKQV